VKNGYQGLTYDFLVEGKWILMTYGGDRGVENFFEIMLLL
jgi:hypothetical protein